MQNLFKIPLLFLSIAGLIGVILRFLVVMPVGWINYSNLLHGHSHVMFLGWVSNVLIIAFSSEFGVAKWFKTIFWLLQVCVVGMLIAFPIQGYGPFSIILSAVHTITSFAFIFLFVRTTKNDRSVASLLAKTSLFFFVLSSIGPFALAYLKTNGLEYSDIYRNSIYLYLHFQYNGFFTFGVLSLFVKLIQQELRGISLRQTRFACYILITCCFPAYVLSILWSQPGLAFNFIGAISAVGQVAGLALLVYAIRSAPLRDTLDRPSSVILIASALSLILKIILQVMSAIPFAAALAEEFRPIVIAYLHLALLGFITFFLLGWLIVKKVIVVRSLLPVFLLIGGYVGSELILVLSPWWMSFGFPTAVQLNLLIVFSLLMISGIILMAEEAIASLFTGLLDSGGQKR